MATREVTKGARELARWLRERPERFAVVMEVLGVSSPCVYQWLSGANRPNDVRRHVLWTMTGFEVTVRSWWTASELAHYAELESRVKEWQSSL